MNKYKINDNLKPYSNNELLKELITKQRKLIYHDKKLQYSDLKRICKYINGSIFDENKCVLWTGYITNKNNQNKGTYINFYFKKKKSALHRLLYNNFIEELSNDEYIKFSCENKGTCCNVMHLKKFKYQKNTNKNIDNKINNKNINKTIKNIEPINFKISFD